MKKIIATLVAALTLSSSAFAKETITIMYSFSLADSMAVFDRALAAEANKIQDKYEFVVDAKPGAGGSIASKYVSDHPENTILSSSAAFFVRPNFYPEASHRVEDFREMLVQNYDPMSAASIKYASFKEIPDDARITIGVSGLGVVSHMISIQLLTRYPNAKIIPFKSTTDALGTLASGDIDIAIGYLGQQEEWTGAKGPNGKKVTILGLTGPKDINGHPAFINSNLPAIFSKMDNPNHLMASVKMPEAKFQEIRAIFHKVKLNKAVTDTYKIDYATPAVMTPAEEDKWWKEQIKHWNAVCEAAKAVWKP